MPTRRACSSRRCATPSNNISFIAARASEPCISGDFPALLVHTTEVATAGPAPRKPGGNPKMLILTRRTGETVMIGNEVTLTVLGVKGNQVRIGINAPKSVPVHREEIYERIKRELQGDANGNVQDEQVSAKKPEFAR